MLKQKRSIVKFRALALTIIVAIVMVGGVFYSVTRVRADQFDQQIQSLQDQNNQAQSVASQLAAQASSYQDAINKLQEQINGLQNAIVDNQNQSDQLQKQINAEEAELVKQKQFLGEDIKQMYLDGQVTTLELLASSNNIGDFIDKEQYRNSVQSKIQTTVDQINALKAQMQSKQKELQSRIIDEKNQQAQIDATQAQQNQLLSLTETQKASYDQQIKANQAQIASLRAQQLAANRRLLGSGSVHVVSSGSCGGGYPADAINQNYGTHWGCNYGQDSSIDNFGMFNRECVSYTAWMVYQTFGYMPYGLGNAEDWPANAASRGVAEGSIPRVHSVAIGTNPYYFGSVGHAMWVEAISGDQILVSQYNFGAPGQYSEMWLNTSLISAFLYF